MGVIHAYGLAFKAANMIVYAANNKIVGVDENGNEIVKFEGITDLTAYTFAPNETYVPSGDDD